MDKINRLGWAEGACLTAYGVRIGLRANQRGMLAELLPHLPPGCRFVDPPKQLDALYSWIVGKPSQGKLRSFGIMYGGTARIARTLHQAELYEAFATSVRLSVALYSPRFIFIHAGAVAWRDRAIIIPGRTLSGKSTLVEALVRAGAEYLSDEYAVLDRHGRVHPFAQPIALRAPGSFAQRALTIDELGGKIAPRAVRPGLIMTTFYREGAASRFRAAPRSRGALDLISNAIAARVAPARVMRAANAAAAQAVVLRGARGTARFTAERVLRLLEADSFCSNQAGGGSRDASGSYAVAT